jgi:small-conductance mechanosensitive channel
MRIFLLLSLLLSFTAPVLAQEATGTITTENSAQQDAAIANRMREILAELGNYSDVTVTVSEGVISLRGTTTSTVEALALEPLATRIEGVVAMVFALVVVVGFAIARLRQPWERLAPNSFVAEIYRQLLRVTFVILGIVIALDILNATALLSTILGAAGIIGLALGFAVRDTVENFIASVMLSFRQPFRPNDTVEINGDSGKVIRLTSRATILLSFDGNHIRIPNATVFKSRIINYTQNAERRFMFSVMIERRADLKATRILVENTVQSLPFILSEPAAQTWIEALHPAGIELVVTGWVDQNETSVVRAKGETLRQMKLAIQEAGITIPDATQAVTLTRDTSGPSIPPRESTRVDPVDAREDEALERIVTAERDTESTEDLLREEGLQE